VGILYLCNKQLVFIKLEYIGLSESSNEEITEALAVGVGKEPYFLRVVFKFPLPVTCVNASSDVEEDASMGLASSSDSTFCVVSSKLEAPSFISLVFMSHK
jgi:hypothetical protein